MKIILKVDESNWTMTHKCLSCTSILSVEASDFSKSKFSDNLVVICQACNAYINISPYSIPESIRRYIINSIL
jgi:transcription elongation factor Elf1